MGNSVISQIPASESHTRPIKLDLTVEEIFFLELLETQENQSINIKYIKNEPQLGKLEQFNKYYSESEILRLLDSLVNKGKITKIEKGVVLLCPKCGGHASMPVLVCPRCGSTKIRRGEDLYHAACEYWGSREEYIEGILLRCPRCNELLDEKAPEGTPGFFSISDPYFECQECGTSVSKNNLNLVCVKCSNKYTTVQASHLNSVSYTLSSETSSKPRDSKPTNSRLREMKEPTLEKNSSPEPKPIESQTENLELQPKPEPEKKTPENEPVNIESTTRNDLVKKISKKKSNETILDSMKKVSEIFKKKPKKKKTRKKKQEKPPLDELEKSTEEPIESISETAELIDEAVVKKILMIVENVTVSEFIIESLEKVKTPINVLHFNDGRSALKELRHNYDTIILDLDLKSIDSKIILSEMERWKISVPIFIVSDQLTDLGKFNLTIEECLNKKQSDYIKISKKLNKLLC